MGCHNIDEEFNNITALMHYSALGDVEIVRLLLDYGADINYQTKIGFTALLGATHHKQEEVVKLLIKRGANTSFKGYEGFTALDTAKNLNHINLIKILTAKDTSNETSFLKEEMQKRVEYDYQELIRDKISKVGIEKTKEYFENTPSLQELEIEIGKLKKDSIPLVVRSLKRTTLLNEDMQKDILINGIGTYDGSYIDETFYGVTFTSIKTNIGYFLDFPCHSSILDPFSKIKLPNGINWDDSIGKLIDITQPFIFVLYGNHIFLHRISKTNFKERGVYQIKNGFFKLEKKLLNFNYSNNEIYDDFFRLVEGENTYETIFQLKDLMEQHNIDINKKNLNYETALIVGIKQGNTQIVKFLLENNAEVNIQDKEGFTPLMMATSLNNYKICKNLLEYGANINTKNYRGQDSSVLASKEMNPEVIILFEEYGVEVNGVEPYTVNNKEEENAQKTLVELEKQLKSKELVTEFLIYGLDFNYDYELDLDYYIKNNSDFLVSFQFGRDTKFNSIAVRTYQVLNEDYLENINASDESKRNIRIRIFDLLMEKYELGKYENSRFSEPLEIKNSDYLLDTLNINEDDYIAQINIYHTYLKLHITNIEDKKIYSFTYQEEKVNLYKNEDRGELIISKNKIIERDKNRNQRISNFTRADSSLAIRDESIHTPKALSDILKKFSSDERIKYSNHIFDKKIDYDTFIKNLKIGFTEISHELESLSPTLYQSISDLFFSEDEAIQGWSSQVIKNEIEQGNLSSNLINELQEKLKNIIVVKPKDKKISLLKRFIDIRKELKKVNNFEIKIDLNYLKEHDIDKFFTDTKRFEQAIKTVFKDINENMKDDTKNVVIEADELVIDTINMIEIRIIHINSCSSQNSQFLKETINKNGGNFKSIYNNLLSVCDWSVDTVCSDGRYRIDYLYPQIDNNKPHCTPVEDTIKGFTHILRFYK